MKLKDIKLKPILIVAKEFIYKLIKVNISSITISNPGNIATINDNGIIIKDLRRWSPRHGG